MPRRSNLLQRVVYQIQHQLATTATVEESVLLADRQSGDHREVDVVLRSRVADHEVTVGIECRDHRRKATVEWVEQMAMKHSTLPTSKLVLVSRAGFSRSALLKAQGLGIDTYSFDEARPKDWSTLLGEGAKDVFAIWSLRILECWMALSENPSKLYPVRPELTVFTKDGSPEGPLGEVVHKSIRSSPEFTQAALDFADKAKESCFAASFRRQPPLFIASGPRHLHQVSYLRLMLEAIPLPSDFHFETARFRDRPIAFAEGESPVGRLTIMLLRGEDGRVAGSARVTEPASGEVDITDVEFTSESRPERGKLAFMTGTIRSQSRGPA